MICVSSVLEQILFWVLVVLFFVIAFRSGKMLGQGIGKRIRRQRK